MNADLFSEPNWLTRARSARRRRRFIHRAEQAVWTLVLILGVGLVLLTLALLFGFGGTVLEVVAQ